MALDGQITRNSNCIACIRLYCIGPCQVQQRWRSRAQTQHEGGSRVFYFWYAGGVWVLSVPFAPLLRIRWLEGPVWTPSPFFKPAWAKPPPGYLQRWRRGQPRRNHTSASDSRSEAAVWARGGCGDHFGLFSAPVRGQGAELEASEGWPARFFIALLYIISGKPGRVGTTKTHPWRAGTGQESI